MTAPATSVAAHRQEIRDSYAASLAEAIKADDLDRVKALREQLATREKQWAREDGEGVS